MRAFGNRPLTEITAAEDARFLSRLDAVPSMGARTVDKHRQVMASVFEYAMRDETSGVTTNPVRATDKRREPDDKPIDFYEPEEVMALARAAECRRASRPAPPRGHRRRAHRARRADEQDAALFVVAAFTGLRLGELLAVRWRNVSFTDAKLRRREELRRCASVRPVRKWRAVPLADQAAAVLARAGRARAVRRHRDDLVFCSAVGEPLDPSAMRRRYHRAQKAARAPPLRFHDLRHSFGSWSSASRPGRRQGLHGPLEDHHHGALPARALAANRCAASDQGIRRRSAGGCGRGHGGVALRHAMFDMRSLPSALAEIPRLTDPSSACSRLSRRVCRRVRSPSA